MPAQLYDINCRQNVHYICVNVFKFMIFTSKTDQSLRGECLGRWNGKEMQEK